MKYLKKVSLASQKKTPDDVKVTLLNEEMKKQLFLNNLEYESSIAGKPKPPQSNSLLHRLWSGIEHLSKTKRQEAISMIKKLESSPSVQINDNYELVYNGELQRGTHILQLIRGELNTNQRALIPGQDVFEHILLTSPAATAIPDFNFVTPDRKSPHKRKRSESSLVPRQSTPRKSKKRKSSEKSPRASFLARTRPPNFVPIVLSPVRTRKQHAQIQENRWKK